MFGCANISVLIVFLSFPLLSSSQVSQPTEQELISAARSNPNGWEANYRLGEFYLHAGKIADGIPWMEAAVRLNPNDYVTGYDLALAYQDTHQTDKAQTQIRAMLTRWNVAELHSLLADVEESSGNYVAAASEYQAAARLDPTDENIFDWAIDLISHHTYDAAVAVLTRGVALYPHSVRMSVGLGTALYLNEQYDRAIKQLCAATDLAPTEPWPYVFLGASYVGMSSPIDSAEVKNRLKRFAALHPNNAKALYYYAVCLWNRGNLANSDTGEAQALMEKAIALDPAFADAHLQLGILYVDQGQYAKAVEQLSSAVRIDPNVATAHYHLAQAYSKTGQKLLASREFQSFQRLRNKDTQKNELDRNRVAQFIVRMKDGGTGDNE